MMVQKRQHQKTHPDSHYAAAVFCYMCEYAICLQSHCVIISLHDKHCIKIGKPGSTVERGKRVINSM